LATSGVLEVCRPKTDKMTFVVQFLLLRTTPSANEWYV